MEKKVQKLPATADPGMQEMLRRSFGELAGQFAKRTNALGDDFESQRHETPLLVAARTSSDEPVRVPGMLWFVVDDGLFYYYNDDVRAFMAVEPTVLAGNQAIVSLGGGVSVVTRVGLPENVWLESCVVGFFSPGTITGSVALYQVGGSSLGSTSFSIAAGNYSQVSVPIGITEVSAIAVEVRVTMTSGSLPVTDATVIIRRLP